MWKWRTGSKATYSRLIKIFERAGYKDYADQVRMIIQHSDSETDNSSGSEEEHAYVPQEQPQTYPSHYQKKILSQSSRAVSKLTETYVIINKENLSGGKTDYESQTAISVVTTV